MNTKKIKFTTGESVRVKDGFVDPDADLNMGGWQGRVQEIYKEHGTFMVHFDSITIQNIPSSYIERCEEEGYDWTSYGFDSDDLEITTSRDRRKDVESAIKKVVANFRYAHLGEEGRDMDKVLAGVDSDDALGILHAWENYLSENLTFPFVAEVSELLTPSRLKIGSKVKVRGISAIDDRYGVIARLQVGRKIVDHPFCDLEVPKASSPNHNPLQLYVVWYANQ